VLSCFLVLSEKVKVCYEDVVVLHVFIVFLVCVIMRLDILWWTRW
jgi:hypothetical protein